MDSLPEAKRQSLRKMAQQFSRQDKEEGSFFIGEEFTKIAKLFFANHFKGGGKCNQCPKNEKYTCPCGSVFPCSQPNCKQPRNECLKGYECADYPLGDCRNCKCRYQDHEFTSS